MATRRGTSSTLRTSTRLKLGYVALAATDTWLSSRSGAWAHRARLATKPLLMPTLAASLATDERAQGSPLRTSTLVAQAAGWGGDVALLGRGTGPFLAGAGSFGIGHAAYLSGFLRQRRHDPMRRAGAPRAVAGVWGATAPVMAIAAARRQRELGAPVLGYATFLAAMTATATHLDPTLSPGARRLTAAGAALFMLSDSLLATRKFVLGERAPAGLEAGVMATYTAAQLLLSEGAARA